LERLRLKVQRFPATGGGSIGIDANGKTVSSSYIIDDGKRYANPDGPEAADTIAALFEALKALEPYLDAIVCYASSMDEHEPNRLAVNARALLAKLEGDAS
jgi:hypothetical protein